MTHYIELDAHSKTCTAVATDFKGTILKKSVFRRPKTVLSALSTP